MLSSADVMKLEFFVPKGTDDRARFLDERITIQTLMREPALGLQPTVSITEAAERLIEAGGAPPQRSWTRRTTCSAS